MADRVDTGGLSAALKMLGAAGHVDVNDDQPDMFEADAPLPLPISRPEPKSGAGRPPGARNRSTEEWARFLLNQGRSPLTVLQQLYSRPTEELVDQLQAMADKHKSYVETKDGGRWERVAINPLDVLKMQRDAAIALAPYVHKKQPLAIEVDERRLGITIIGDLGGDLGGDEDGLALTLAPIEENQQLASVGATIGQDASDSKQSDGSQ